MTTTSPSDRACSFARNDSPPRVSTRHWYFAALIALIPAIARSEGAVRVLECSYTKVCDASGACRTESGKVSFRMEPISVNADGSGRFKIKYGEIAATMAALSEAGPFLWSEDGVKNVLLVSDATDFLWHRRTPVPAPHATIRFMTCTLHQ